VAQIRPPISSRRRNGAAELLLASTAGQELVHAVGHQQTRFSPLSSKAGQGKSLPDAVALQQVVHRHSFIVLSVSPLLHSPLRPPEKKSEKERP
jgi:hypothetical protein